MSERATPEGMLEMGPNCSSVRPGPSARRSHPHRYRRTHGLIKLISLFILSFFHSTMKLNKYVPRQWQTSSASELHRGLIPPLQ